MELRHLRYFLAVAEELNFSRAAERLHIAQPPLSQQIKDLETELGVLLFERTKRQVKLTPPGRVFFQEAQRVLEQAEWAAEMAKLAAKGQRGRLSIGFNSSATYSVLPKILREYRRNCPDVELILQELTTTQQIESLSDNRIDVGLLYSPLDKEALNSLLIYREPLIMALNSHHPLSQAPNPSLEMFKNESFILPPYQIGGGLYKQIMSFFEEVNFVPKLVQEAIQLQTMISLVAGGVGIAIVPASLQNLQLEGVVYRSLQETTPEIEIAVAWRQNNCSPILNKFLASISSVSLSSA